MDANECDWKRFKLPKHAVIDLRQVEAVIVIGRAASGEPIVELLCPVGWEVRRLNRADEDDALDTEPRRRVG